MVQRYYTTEASANTCSNNDRRAILRNNTMGIDFHTTSELSLQKKGLTYIGHSNRKTIMLRIYVHQHESHEEMIMIIIAKSILNDRILVS